MGQAIFAALVNGVGVALGLWVLWSVISRMPRENRAFGAVTAGLVSFLLSLLVSAAVSGWLD
jgi:hypothetical protein